jgi:A-macroglobulin complement component/alpha-2-macroglobulin family protein/MG2 domain-containing protein/carboxypeptidase family protein/A-macroglobulin receptor/macroglobulin-like protein
MNRRFMWIFAFALLASVAIVESFPATPSNSESLSATYSRGVLHVNIPYQTPHTGAGALTVEVLDPDDSVLAHSERRIDAAASGVWQEDLKLAKPLPIDDLVWQRVRYRFTYADASEAAIEGAESVSQILRMPVIRILGQQSYLAGAAAAVRVIVTDSKNDPVAGATSIRIELDGRSVYAGALNRHGTADARFNLPAGLIGSHALRCVADTPLGSAEVTQTVRIEDKASILLTTEKPQYQPGQTIHVRALALDRANHQATAGRPLTFELEDSRGNKVFKKATTTSDYGIASAEFSLADEVNLGTYHLRALMENNRAELALNVERYVLPKFKVAIEFTGKAVHGYRPGDHVTGTVRANYFFGKPVEGEVVVKASAMDVAMVETAPAKGKTDRDGAYKFDLTLPGYLAGNPLAHGAIRALVEASVKDSASHFETRGEPITVSQSPLLITAVPEGGTLIPNLENQVFVLTSYADGKPASTTVMVHGQSVKTDAGGVALIRLAPGPGVETLQMEATDAEGNHASTSLQLQTRQGPDQILLRTERAVYRAGDRIQLKVFSTKARGTAYVDVIKDGQTVLTRDLDIVNGQAELTVPATPALAGTLDCNAYLFGRDARPVGDHRLLFVQPSDELKIEATADAPAYKPGDDARIRFRVTNSHGEGVQAALGLQVVDEAVFALAEKQPGFAKVFFYLEQEAMKPRYEIHSIGMTDVVDPGMPQPLGAQNLAARALFAATEMVNTNRFETEAGRTVPQAKYAEYANRYRTRFVEQARLQLAGGPELRDAWGSKLRVDGLSWGGAGKTYQVRSAGPDKQFNNADDLYAFLTVRSRKIVGSANAGPSSIQVAIEHDRGPYNGRADITGTVVDPQGGALEGSTVAAKEIATGQTRTTAANADGAFRFAGLIAGEYEVRVSDGPESASAKLTLKARDRAVLAVHLKTAPGTLVVSQAQRIRMGGNPRGFLGDELVIDGAGGMGGGMAGGVLGGIVGGVPAAMPVNGRFMAMAGMQMAEMQTVAVTGAPHALKAELAPFANNGAINNNGAPPAARVRSYFPEALYINPEIITDQHGVASISIPMADSITTWRMAMMASTAHGLLGSGTSSLKVFQDFFVDLDLPVTLTQGDRVSIPVGIYDYASGPGEVSLQLQPSDWYTLVEDTADKSLAVEPGRVGGSQFTLEAKRIGKFKLTLAAHMKGAANRADIVVREIEVIPNGREQSMVFNGRLETTAAGALAFPAGAIPDASKVLVRLYPGPLSQVIEGMDSLLRMPFGCFEQTSSATYPNVLALDYMKRTNKLTPEVHAKAEGFIANGYQRLLTFEVPGGGFSWFGSAPANKILTAYGLMEFSDMAKVHDVDPNLIRRTQQWIVGQQQADGSWKPDTSFINEGATNRYNKDALRIAAYLGWSLANTGYQGPAVEKARQFVEGHMDGKPDSYTLAVLANFAADYAKDRAFTNRAIQLLLDARTERDDKVWWTSEETGVFATGESAAVETTGLAVQALLKSGQASATAGKALAYIASKKDAAGAWRTTQATIMALRALLLSTEKGAADVRGTVEISINSKPVKTLTLTPDNNDLLHQFVFDGAPENVSLKFDGKGGLAYQIVGRYFVPWDRKPAGEPLSIDVTYDRTHLSQDDLATATATIKNNLPQSANMVMVDLGIPPGFDLLSEDLQAYQGKKGHLQKFSLTATQAVLYLDAIAPGETVTFRYRMRAKYPIRARTFQSRVYEYYDPEVNSVARPVQLEVGRK